MSKNNGTINTCCGIINEDNSTMKRVFLKGNLSFAKAYKGYVAHYWTAFAIEKDEGNGGPSYYKHYVTKTFNNKSDCIYYTQRITETPEMEKRYPIYGTVYQVWFMGCDKRW